MKHAGEADFAKDLGSFDLIISAVDKYDESVVLKLLDLLDLAFLSRPLTIATGVKLGTMPYEYHPVLTSLALSPKRHRAFSQLLILLEQGQEKNAIATVLMTQSAVIADDDYHYPYNRMNVLHVLLYECSEKLPEFLCWINQLMQKNILSNEQLHLLISPKNAPNQLFDRMHYAYRVGDKTEQYLLNLECLWKYLFNWHAEKKLSADFLLKIFTRDGELPSVTPFFLHQELLVNTSFKTQLIKQLYLLCVTPSNALQEKASKELRTACAQQDNEIAIEQVIQIALFGVKNLNIKKVTSVKILDVITKLSGDDLQLKFALLTQANDTTTFLGQAVAGNIFSNFFVRVDLQKTIANELIATNDALNAKRPSFNEPSSSSSTSSTVINVPAALTFPPVPNTELQLNLLTEMPENPKKNAVLLV